MKITLISNMYPSKTDRSYGIFVENFVKSMKRSGVKFSAICVIRGRKKNKIFKVLAYLKLYTAVIFNILFKSTDIIYVHYPLQTAPILCLLRMFTAKPFVLNFHGSDLFSSENIPRFIKSASQRLAKESEMIVVPSNYFKDQLSEIFKIDKLKIVVSPSAGIDFEIFNRNDPDASDKRKYFAGFISRIDEEKGWDTFLKALSILKEKGSLGDKKCLLLGNGAQDHLKSKMIADLELEDFIDVRDAVHQQELPQCYKSLELFVFPSERKAESLGLVGLEAMACGIPVLGADNGGIANYIEGGKNGLLFEKGNAEDLASKIVEFLEMTKIKRMSIEEKAYETATLYENSRVSMNLVKELEKRFFVGRV